MKWEDHVNAIRIFNNACSRTVGASGEVEAPTELGLILIGAEVPTQLFLIRKTAAGFATDPTQARCRIRGAKWLRDLADRIEAHELLQTTSDPIDSRPNHLLNMIAIMEQRPADAIYIDMQNPKFAEGWKLDAQQVGWWAKVPIDLLNAWSELSVESRATLYFFAKSRQLSEQSLR